MTPAAPFKAVLASFASSVAVLAWSPALAEARPQAAQARYTIPAQPLADAIAQLAAQADAAIVAPADLVAGEMSSPVTGARSVSDAIAQMLEGAGLRARLDASGVYIVSAAPARASQAAAQTLTDEVETVTVYGAFSGGLDRSLSVKRGADAIVDAIVASEIGTLPAVNAAEALQRLLGVTVSREAGEGEFIGVRGLGPNFQSVTFNGVPLAVNENIRNSDQSGRQFRFRVLPADLIGAIVVTKSPTADLIDGGIGANIDIVTLAPLQRDSFLGFRVYGGVDERVGEATPNGSVSAGWRSKDGRVGVVGGASFQQREAQFDRFQNFGYETHAIDGVDGVQVASGWNTTVEEERRRRFSLVGGAQWRPTDDLEMRGELLYSNFNNAIAENRVTYEFGADDLNNLVPGSARITDGVLHAGAIAGGQISRNAEFSEQTHDNLAIGVRADWRVAGWRVAPSVSFSQANSGLDTPLQRIESHTTDDAHITYAFDLGDDPVGSGEIAALYTDLDLTDPAAVPFRRYRIRPINSEDQDKTALIDMARALDVSLGPLALTEMRFGGQWTGRYRDYQRRDRTASPRPGITVDSNFFSANVPGDAMAGIITGRRSAWVGPDYERFADAFWIAGEYDGVAPQTADLAPNASDLRQSYRVEEEVQALFARIDFAGETGGLNWSGNAGLRWVKTDTIVHGTLVTAQAGADGSAEMISAPRMNENSYSAALPSLNVRFDVSEDVVLRAAASRSMTRPSLASLRDATVPSSATTSEIFERGAAALEDAYLDRAAVGGNPALSPYLASNADVSLEWYFQSFGAVTASAFYKEIDNFIAGDVSVEAMPFAVRNGGSVTLDLHVNRPQNIGDATLSGLELGYSGRTTTGIGLAVAAMLTASDVTLRLADGTSKRGSLQGVSDVSFSITPFFDRDRIEAYLSYTYRSAFESNANVTIASTVETEPGETQYAAGFGTLDFGASYKVSDGFELFAEGVNLTGEHQTAYLGSTARLYQIHDYGRSFNLGVRGKF